MKVLYNLVDAQMCRNKNPILRTCISTEEKREQNWKSSISVTEYLVKPSVLDVQSTFPHPVLFINYLHSTSSLFTVQYVQYTRTVHISGAPELCFLYSWVLYPASLYCVSSIPEVCIQHPWATIINIQHPCSVYPVSLDCKLSIPGLCIQHP